MSWAETHTPKQVSALRSSPATFINFADFSLASTDGALKNLKQPQSMHFVRESTWFWWPRLKNGVLLCAHKYRQQRLSEKRKRKNKNKNACLPKFCRALKVKHFSRPASGAATTVNSTSSPNPLIWTMAASWYIGSGWDRCEETTTSTSKSCFCGLSCHCALFIKF